MKALSALIQGALTGVCVLVITWAIDQTGAARELALSTNVLFLFAMIGLMVRRKL